MDGCPPVHLVIGQEPLSPSSMSGVDPSELSKIVGEHQKKVTTLHEQLLHVEMFKAGVPETTIDVLRTVRIFNVTDIDTADAKIVDLKQDLNGFAGLLNRPFAFTPIFISSFSHPVWVATVGTVMRNVGHLRCYVISSCVGYLLRQPAFNFISHTNTETERDGSARDRFCWLHFFFSFLPEGVYSLRALRPAPTFVACPTFAFLCFL